MRAASCAFWRRTLRRSAAQSAVLRPRHSAQADPQGRRNPNGAPRPLRAETIAALSDHVEAHREMRRDGEVVPAVDELRGAQASETVADIAGGVDGAGDHLSITARCLAVGHRPITRLLICAAGVVILAGFVSGMVGWCWTQIACLLELHSPMRLPLADAAGTVWRLLMRGGWSAPARAFPSTSERATARERGRM